MAITPPTKNEPVRPGPPGVVLAKDNLSPGKPGDPVPTAVSPPVDPNVDQRSHAEVVRDYNPAYIPGAVPKTEANVKAGLTDAPSFDPKAPVAKAGVATPQTSTAKAGAGIAPGVRTRVTTMSVTYHNTPGAKTGADATKLSVLFNALKDSTINDFQLDPAKYYAFEQDTLFTNVMMIRQADGDLSAIQYGWADTADGTPTIWGTSQGAVSLYDHANPAGAQQLPGTKKFLIVQATKSAPAGHVHLIRNG